MYKRGVFVFYCNFFCIVEMIDFLEIVDSKNTTTTKIKNITNIESLREDIFGIKNGSFQHFFVICTNIVYIIIGF